MNLIDEEFTAHPFTGIERMVEFLRREHCLIVNHKRIRRLMRKMCLMAIYPRPRTSYPAPVYMKYPCLLNTTAIKATACDKKSVALLIGQKDYKYRITSTTTTNNKQNTQNKIFLAICFNFV